MAENLYVKVSKEGYIAIITIGHPAVNALDTPTLAELDKVLNEIKKDNAVKAVIITGAGKSCFSAGADINEMIQLKSAREAKRFAFQGQNITTKIEKLGKPVIAAINGFCLGGGNELAMACDIRIASDKACFGQPEVKLGIIPGFGATQRLPRLVGKAKAKELILTGDIITAQEAWRIGLINKVVPEDEVLKEAKNLAKKILSQGQISIAGAIKAINQGLKLTLEEGLALEAKLFGQICQTQDMREGLKAFLEKRQPKFQDQIRPDNLRLVSFRKLWAHLRRNNK